MVRKKNDTKDENFFSDVYGVVSLIPKGRATSYGAIASYLGAKSSARMVGWAMNQAPASIPAHRVVNRNGMLTGKMHFSSPYQMQRLLEQEGIRIAKDTIINFADIFWDPAKELL